MRRNVLNKRDIIHKEKYDKVVDIIKYNYIKYGHPTKISSISKIMNTHVNSIYRLAGMAILNGDIQSVEGIKWTLLPSNHYIEWPYQELHEYYLDKIDKSGLKYLTIMPDDAIFENIALNIGVLVNRNMEIGDVVCYTRRKKIDAKQP